MKSKRLGTVIGFIVSAALVASVGAIAADVPRVSLPDNYASHFVRYLSVDKPAGQRPAKVRFFYVHPDSLAAAQANQPLPDGTLLIMEDRALRRDDAGQPLRDGAGRFVAADEITNIFVQQKRAGWGAGVADALRNGDWSYGWFRPDGSYNAEASLDGCFRCHQDAAGDDYTFTFAAFVKRIKP